MRVPALPWSALLNPSNPQFPLLLPPPPQSPSPLLNPSNPQIPLLLPPPPHFPSPLLNPSFLATQTSLLAISALVSVALPPASSPIALAISLSASAAAAASSAVLQVALHRLVPLSGAALWGPVSAGQAAAGAIVPAIGVLAHLSGDIGHRDASAALLLAALALAAAGLLSVPHVLRRLPEMGPVVQAASAWQATLSPEAEAWSAGPAGCQPPDAVDVVDAADAYLAAPADTLDPRERRSASRPPTDAHQAYPPGPGTVASATSSVVEAVETVMTTAICTGMGLAPARPDTPIRDRLSLGAAAALRPGRGSLDDTMASRSAMAAASVAGSPGVAHWHRASATAATPRGYRPGWSLPRPGTAVERRPRSAGRFPADRGPRALASSPPGGISASPQASPELPSVPFAVPSPAVMYAGRQLAFLPHYRPPPRPLPPASITSEGESASFHAPGATTPPRGPSSGGRTPSPGLSVSGDAAAAAVAAAAVSSLTFSAGDGINPGSPGGSGFFTWAKPSGAAGEGASARGVGASVAFQGPGGVDDWANADLEAARAEILQILVPARHRGALAGVAHVVWDDGVAAFLAGAVTWTLFPGVVGSIRPGTWAGAMPDDAFPLLLFAFFGAADVVGRWIPSAMSDCGMRMFTGPVLVAAALVR